jgi:hypothetical protein
MVWKALWGRRVRRFLLGDRRRLKSVSGILPGG